MIKMIINIHLGEGNAVHLLVQLVPKNVRRVLRRFIITLVAFVWFFSTVFFNLSPRMFVVSWKNFHLIQVFRFQ